MLNARTSAKPGGRLGDVFAQLAELPGSPRTRVFSVRNARPRILAAARDLWAPGVPPPTIQQLAQLSGLSRRALYNHFRNLEEVRLALLREVLNELAEANYPAIARSPAPGAAIATFVEEAATLMRGDAYRWIVHLVTGANDPYTASSVIAAARAPLKLTLENYLLHCRLSGACRHCDPGWVAEWLLRIIEATCTAPHVLAPGEDCGPIAREIAAMFLARYFRASDFEANSMAGSPAIAVMRL